MINGNEIEEIEISIDSAKRTIELGKSLEKLKKNKEFKEIILDGYFNKEAVRLVGLKRDPNCQDPVQQADIDQALNGISELQEHFRKIERFADQAEIALKDFEEAKDEVLSEG